MPAAASHARVPSSAPRVRCHGARRGCALAACRGERSTKTKEPARPSCNAVMARRADGAQRVRERVRVRVRTSNRRRGLGMQRHCSYADTADSISVWHPIANSLPALCMLARAHAARDPAGPAALWLAPPRKCRGAPCKGAARGQARVRPHAHTQQCHTARGARRPARCSGGRRRVWEAWGCAPRKGSSRRGARRKGRSQQGPH